MTLSDDYDAPQKSVAPFDLIPDFLPENAATLTSDIAHTSSPHEHQDIVAQLAYEFAMTVQNPAFLHTLSRQEPISGASQEHLPAMSPAEQAQYAALFPSHYSTEDILNGPLTISRILDDLGEDDPDILKQEEHEDVLMLFADCHRRLFDALPKMQGRLRHSF